MTALRQFLYRHVGLRIGLLFLPVLLLLALCMAIPLGVMFVFSFWRVTGFSLTQRFSLDNYIYIAGNAIFLRLILKAVAYGVVVTAITMLLGYPVAYFMARRLSRMKALLLNAIIIPLFTSDLIRYFAWRSILGTNGFLNNAMLALGLAREPIEFLSFSPIAVIISLVHVYLPFMILAIWVSLEVVNPQLIEAAMDLGAKPARTIRTVVLPLSIPGLVAGTLFVFVPVTGEYFGVNIMGGMTGFTITNAINDQFTSALNWPLGSAMSFLLLGCIGVAVALLLMMVIRSSYARNYLTRSR
jgi:spermidine/putrescine transport system permease protein